eukprot:m.160537 g.160537  ORF g.160537 m.160537 type:complete len:624 (+) comp16363_c4_seq2:1485-3356(+)
MHTNGGEVELSTSAMTYIHSDDAVVSSHSTNFDSIASQHQQLPYCSEASVSPQTQPPTSTTTTTALSTAAAQLPPMTTTSHPVGTLATLRPQLDIHSPTFVQDIERALALPPVSSTSTSAIAPISFPAPSSPHIAGVSNSAPTIPSNRRHGTGDSSCGLLDTTQQPNSSAIQDTLQLLNSFSDADLTEFVEHWIPPPPTVADHHSENNERAPSVKRVVPLVAQHEDVANNATLLPSMPRATCNTDILPSTLAVDEVDSFLGWSQSRHGYDLEDMLQPDPGPMEHWRTPTSFAPLSASSCSSLSTMSMAPSKKATENQATTPPLPPSRPRKKALSDSSTPQNTTANRQNRHKRTASSTSPIQQNKPQHRPLRPKSEFTRTTEDSISSKAAKRQAGGNRSLSTASMASGTKLDGKTTARASDDDSDIGDDSHPAVVDSDVDVRQDEQQQDEDFVVQENSTFESHSFHEKANDTSRPSKNTISSLVVLDIKDTQGQKRKKGSTSRKKSGRRPTSSSEAICPVCQGVGRNSDKRICGICYSGLYNDVNKVARAKLHFLLTDDEQSDLKKLKQALKEVSRGCKNKYKCNESAWRYNLNPSDKCTRCRSLHVIDVVPTLATATMRTLFG